MQHMLTNLRARREDEGGFTLIELMVVVLIIAILIAIAIPTFLGAKSRAQDKAAQSSLRNALTNAKGIYTDTDSYANATVAALNTAEPSLTFVAAGTSSGTAKTVSVNSAIVPAAGGTAIIMTAWSASNVCYVIGDWSTGGTFFAKVTATVSTCTATSATTTLTTVAPAAGTASPNATTAGVWAQAW